MLTRIFLLLSFIVPALCYGQADSSRSTTGDTTKKVIPPESTPKVVEGSLESYYETLSYKDVNYEVKVARNSQSNFTIQLSRVIESKGGEGGDTELSRVEMSKINLNENFEYNEFKSITLELLKQIAVLDAAALAAVKVEPLMDFQLSRIYSNVQRKIKLQNDPHVQQLEERLKAFAGELEEKYRYAGQLRIKNDTVPTYAFNKDFNKDKKHFDSLLARKIISAAQYPAWYIDAPRRDKPTSGKFVVDSVYVSVFNNAIEKLAIYGQWFDTSKKQSGSTQRNHPSRVLNRSIGMRGLNLRDYQFDINEGSKNKYYIKLNDLLEYAPLGDNFGYIIKDQSFWIKRNKQDSVPLMRRTLFDYLSLITFLDFLGVSSKINNNFIQIEGRARFPLVLSSWAKPPWLSNVTLFPMSEIYLNASFVNGNNFGGRKGNVFTDTSGGGRQLFYDHFDLLRNYNIKSGLSLGLFSLNYKAIHSKIFFTYDLKMYRSAFEYSNLKPGEDSLVQTNLFALSHGPSLLFEYRPDFNIGADLRFSIDYDLNPFNAENNNLLYKPTAGPIYKDQPQRYSDLRDKDKRIYGIELNAYSFLSPEKSKTDGIYFRFAVFTNKHFTQVSPYILAGYATSLKGLVKKKGQSTAPKIEQE